MRVNYAEDCFNSEKIAKTDHSNDSNASSIDALDEPREVTESSFEEELDDLGDPGVVADDLLDELER